jgi:hypothetical protein
MRIAPLILFTGAVLLAPAAVRAQEGEISVQARAHFQAGVNSLQDPDGARYEEAYREFKAAYQASPSWKILGNLGIAAMKLERDGEAIEAFQKYLSGGAATLAPEEREQFQRDLGTLQAGVVKLTIDLNVPGATITDERVPVTGSAVRNTYVPEGQHLEIGVRAGHHKITASAPGYPPLVWEMEAVSGVAQTHAFELERLPVPTIGPTPGDGPTRSAERPIPTGVYVGLAATGVFAVGAGVMGGLALAKHSDYESNNDGTNPSAAKDLHDSGQTLNLVTDVLIGGAVVAGGITALLYFTRPTMATDRGALRVTPVAGPRVAGLSVAGSF